MRNRQTSSSITKSLREPEIKAALIDALYDDGRIDGETIIVSEMPVASMARRADIVVANGHLLGFEIKSDGDKTSRLRGQLEAYQKSFEGIVIVTGARHLDECLATTRSTVGVVAIDQIEACVPRARMIRKPHLRRLGMDAALRQMRADELFRFARQVGANPTGARDRFTLECIARELPATLVRDAALRAVKARYREPFAAFNAVRETSKSTLEALAQLRRPILNRTPVSAVEAVGREGVDDEEMLKRLSLAVRPRRVA